VIIQPQGWEPLMKLVGREDLVDHPDYATPEARLTHLDECFTLIEGWTMGHTKLEAMQILNDLDVPCGPILDMKELLEDSSLAARGMIVEVEHPKRGVFKTVGCPLILSDSPVTITSSPLLGEHTDVILHGLLGMNETEIAHARSVGAV
jgi:formyl-CoA transferase